MNLFVSGRLCLFGEHSDWAGEYRQVNPQILPGMAIAVGTNQGIYARISKNSSLIFKTLHSASILELAMDEELLLAMAQTNDFYSYVAGVAYQALKRYRVGGLNLDNYCMDLPLKKGLSSSAAICLLVAKAFNQLYDLGLDLKGEMELAYQGEKTTPSQCGRLDLACAYGQQPVLMTFDGEREASQRHRCLTQPLTVGRDLYLCIVDLAGAKDTQKILAQLNQCYPEARDAIAARVQTYLGETNQKIVSLAQKAIELGDAVKIGSLMNQAQAEFDRCLAPACPEQLNAPVLHRLLNHAALQPYICGGKGIGSQGDGTAQFITTNPEARNKAIAIIKRDFPQMRCYKLDIPQQIPLNN